MATYPLVRAGQRITNELLTANEEFFILKPTITSRASTTTFTDDPHLTTQLVANAIYYIEFHIHASNIATSGFQTMWTVPTGTCLRSCWGPDDAVTLDGSAGGTPRQGVHGAGTAVGYGDRDGDNGLQYIAKERGYIITTASGTLALSWTQQTSNANATNVNAGSYMTVNRLA